MWWLFSLMGGEPELPAPVPSEPASPELVAQIKAHMQKNFPQDCLVVEDGGTDAFKHTEVHVLPGVSGKRLVEVPCSSGAYNFSSAFFYWTPGGGLEEVQFAHPVFSHHLEPDGEGQKTVVDKIEGFRVERMLINSSYNADTSTIGSYYKARGVGDAYTSGRWHFDSKHGFVLQHYEVDLSYDGHISSTVVFSGNKPDKTKH